MKRVDNAQFKVVGVTFSNADGVPRQDVISNMNKDSEITLSREPFNQYDMYAIAVYTKIYGHSEQVGYIPKEYARLMAPIMDQGAKLEAKIVEVDRYKNTWYCHIIVNEVE